MPQDLSTLLPAAVTGPASASVDGVSVSAQSAAEIIKADQYLALKAAAALRHRGLRFTRLQPPAAASPRCGPTSIL